jgi:two-component system OmpR family response regulator
MSEVPDSGLALVSHGAQVPDVYDDGHLRVEHDNYYVTCGEEALRFRRAEFLLLSRLARSSERIVKAEELWRHAWGEGKPYNAESLHVHVYRLRNKLAPFGVRIETMVNVGYRLVPAVQMPERRSA